MYDRHQQCYSFRTGFLMTRSKLWVRRVRLQAPKMVVILEKYFSKLVNIFYSRIKKTPQASSSALLSAVVTSHMGLQTCKIKSQSIHLVKLKISSSVTLAISQGLNSHMWQVTTVEISMNIEHFHHHWKFFWKPLIHTEKVILCIRGPKIGWLWNCLL